jgi:hypothetical protein
MIYWSAFFLKTASCQSVSNVFPAAHGAKAGTALVSFRLHCQNWAVFNKSNVSIGDANPTTLEITLALTFTFFSSN